MSNNLKQHLRSSLISGLGFGLGFLLGTLFTSLIFSSGLLELASEQVVRGRLITGIILVIFSISLGGAVAGAIGGLSLTYANKSHSRVGFAWRGALSMGPSYGAIVLPLTIVVFGMAFYEFITTSPLSIIAPMMVMGAIFGLLSGIILGFLTVGWDAWRVIIINTLGFGVAGAIFGRNIWIYFFGPEGLREATWIFFLAIFLFGGIGGAALGSLYSWLELRTDEPSLFSRLLTRYRSLKWASQILVLVLLVILGLAIRSLLLMSPLAAQQAALSHNMASNTIGTHWSAPQNMLENSGVQSRASGPDIFAQDPDLVASVWSQEDGDRSNIHFAQQLWDSNSKMAGWLPAINVSSIDNGVASAPAVVVDSRGTAHVVWTEADSPDAASSNIFYSQCVDQSCSMPTLLSQSAEMSCVSSPQNDSPAVAIDQADNLMVTWRNGQNGLPYSRWTADDAPPEGAQGCIPTPGQNSTSEAVGQPRLAGSSEGFFSVTFDQIDEADNAIYLAQLSDQDWTLSPDPIGVGHSPELLIDADDQIFVAWCDPNQQLAVWSTDQTVSPIEFPRCTARPELVKNGDGQLSIIWYSDEVINVGEVINPNSLLYQSTWHADIWSTPVIVNQTGAPTQPAAATGPDGTLHLIWNDSGAEDESLHYANQINYDCSQDNLSTVGQVIFDIASQEKFRPASDDIPFCYNKFESLTYAPNPDPAFSNDEPTPNGPFDRFADLARTANFEVVFATMWYDAPSNGHSPGRVLAEAIADLYQNLKEDPARYPRGLTIRILLGNPPEFNLFPNLSNQTWVLLEDLRAAGIPEMTNSELGWKLEIGNFRGSWPHSHGKLMVVDGASTMAVGYNMQHSHLPVDNPSRKAKGRVDLGMHITGPIAQFTQRSFDDLWQASTKITCAELRPEARFFWALSCDEQRAVADHAPEVLQYFIPEANDNAFSLYRTQNFREADEAHSAALASAQETLDVMHINFSLDLICGFKRHLHCM